MKKDTESELLLETDSDEAGSHDSNTDMDTNTNRWHNKNYDAASGSQVHIQSRP